MAAAALAALTLDAPHRTTLHVVSPSGKPVWCSCADVEPGRLATTCAVVSACVAIAEITEIDAGDRKIVIDRHGELIFVACGFRESAAALRRFTRAAHDAVLASLTDKIHAALERRPNADIGALLGSAKLVLAGLARTEDRSRMLGPLGLATESVPDLLLEPGVRRSIQGALKDALASLKGVPVVGAVLLWRDRLASVARPKNIVLHPRDMNTLVNFLASQRGALSTGAAAWTPVCLPVLGSRGFLHAYVAGLGDDVVLALLGAAPDAFEQFHACRARLDATLLEAGAFQALRDAAGDLPSEVLGDCEHAAVVFERDGLRRCLCAAGGDAATSREYDGLVDRCRGARGALACAFAGGRTFAGAPLGRYTVFAAFRGRVPTARVVDELAALAGRAGRCEGLM